MRLTAFAMSFSLVPTTIISDVSQEALQAIKARGLERQLRGLILDSRRAARQGMTVHAGDAPVGVVTSGALSPTLGHPIAMARVRRELASGSNVVIDVRGNDVTATVVDLPFYSRP